MPHYAFDYRYGSDWDRWDDYGVSRGWSRPEFNRSLPRHRDPADYAPEAWSARANLPLGIDAPGRWRTGEPWGGQDADADLVRARDLMTENPEAVTPDTSLVDVAIRMRDLDVGVIPVVEDLDQSLLRGIVTDRDIVIRAAANGADLKRSRVGDFMSGDVCAVREHDSARDIFTVMKREQVRRVPVVDGGGRLVGIVALADLAVDYAELDPDRELEVEEVIGRISESASPHRGVPRPAASSPRHFPRRAPGGAWRSEYDRELSGRMRQTWRALRREARHLLDRGYDGGWR